MSRDPPSSSSAANKLRPSSSPPASTDLSSPSPPDRRYSELEEEEHEAEHAEEQAEEVIEYRSRPCTTCRKRRVRCNRSLPVCRNCTKRDEHCVYPGGARSSTSKTTTTAAASTVLRSNTLDQELESRPKRSTRASKNVAPPPRTPPRKTPPPHALRLPPTPRAKPPSPLALPPPHPGPFPTFPRSPPPQQSLQLRQAREILCRLLVEGSYGMGTEEELGMGLQELAAKLNEVDSSPSVPTARPLLDFSPFSHAAADPPTFPPPFQARLALSAYFRSIEPSLRLFTPSAQARFEEQCVSLWSTGWAGAGGGKGWMAMYLATVALGLTAVSEDEARQAGIQKETGETVAAEWAAQAARSLATDGFPSFPTVEGFRASLLLIHFDLGGLTGVPDIPTISSTLPLLRAAAYELELQEEPRQGMGREEEEERRGLWERFFEVEAAWSPLIGQRLPLNPASVPTQPTPPSLPFRSPISPTSTLTDGAPPLRAVLLLSARLSHLLNSPYPPTPIDLALLSDHYIKIKQSLDEHATAGEGGENGLARVLLKAVFFRLRAVADEAGAMATLEEEQEWERKANDLLNDVDLIFRCDRFQQLLALTTFLHSLILVAFRLRTSLAPGSAPTITSSLRGTILALEARAWPVLVQPTLRRGLVTLNHLLYSTQSLSETRR